MKFREEMKKYKLLSLKDRYKKVINLLRIIKNENADLLETYNIIVDNPNIEISKIDNVYKVVLQSMIYQQSLDNKKNYIEIQNINSSLKTYLEEERLEREQEEKECENLIKF